MNCPKCKAAVPAPSDPTVRRVTCPGCAASVDLAAIGSEGTLVRTVIRATPPTDPLVGTDFAGGRYRVEALLGIGGMGRVYTANQRGLSRKVALKILSPEFARDDQFRRRFDREAGTLSSLEHPNIVTVHDVGVEGDTPYIVMSLVRGPKGEPMSLRNLLDGGPMDEEWALRIVQQTCAALEYAHGRGVIHRDIKPGNILIDAQGNAKIADFGIARVAGAGEASQLTSTGAVLGTLRYMAPEQMVDSAQADARSDLYSLGVVLYEMLTGEAPVGRFEMPSEAKKGLDQRLDGIVDRALRRAATQRYQSAAEMARDISRITTEREYGRLNAGAVAKDAPAKPTKAAAEVAVVREDRVPSPAASGPTRQAAKPRPRWLVPAILAGVVGAVVGTILLIPGPRPEPPKPAGSNSQGVPPPAAHPDPNDRRATPGPPTAQPAANPETPEKPVPSDAARTDGEPQRAVDEANLSDDDREEIADAKDTVLDLIATGTPIPPDEFESGDTTLPAVKGTDLAGAKAAVETSLDLLKAGKASEVAARIPDALLESIGKGISKPPTMVRAILSMTDYSLSSFSLRSTGKAVAIGKDWALVKYGTVRSNGATASGVAVCVREGGVWKVFL